MLVGFITPPLLAGSEKCPAFFYAQDVRYIAKEHRDVRRDVIQSCMAPDRYATGAGMYLNLVRMMNTLCDFFGYYTAVYGHLLDFPYTLEYG